MTTEALSGLTYLEQNGASAHALVNAAINLLAIAGTRFLVVNETTTNAPATPTNGDVYIVSGTPSTGDDWDDIGATDEDLVYYYDGWILFPSPPREGLRAYNQATNVERVYDGTTWTNA